MTDATLDRFRKRTRWVYYKGSVAYGPNSADEIVTLLRDGVIGPETELMEMGAGRRVQLTKVAYFAAAAERVARKNLARDEEQAYESARSRLGQARGLKFYLINITIPVILLSGIGFAIYYFGFRDRGGEDRAQAAVQEVPAGEQAKRLKTVNLAGEEEEKLRREARAMLAEGKESFEEPEGAALEEFAIGILAEKGNDSARKVKTVKGRDKELEVLPEMAKEKRRSRSSGGGAASAGSGGQAGAEEMDFSEMDFSEDDGNDLIREVERRMATVLEECAGKAGGGLSMQADFTLQPGGRVSGLRLIVEPGDKLADMRMCVRAGMAAIMMPPFEGAPVTGSASL